MDMSGTNGDVLTKCRKKSLRLHVTEIPKSIATEPFSRSLCSRFEFTEGPDSFNEKLKMFLQKER